MDEQNLSDFILSHAVVDQHKDAIVYKDEVISYEQLKVAITEFKACLESLNLKKGSRVIIMMDAEPDSIIALLAVMSYGAISVPVSTETPKDRFALIVDTIRPILIVVSNTSGFDLGMEPVEMYRSMKLHLVNSSDSYQNVDDEKYAYIIMTSGTTGIAKGITMSHRAAIAAVKGYADLDIIPENRIGSISPLHFDFSTFDLAVTFYSDATLILIPKMLAHHAKGLANYLHVKQATHMHSVPSAWRPVIDADNQAIYEKLQNIETILYAAESFPINKLKILEANLPGAKFVQSFGHTESMGCTFKKLGNPIPSYNGYVSIGKGLIGTEIFALNDNMEETKDGEIGELYVKGANLFSKYWNNQEQTNNVLINDPRGLDGIAFKSGDLVFHDEDDEYYFVGRNDHQIKISGNRIELSEIDKVINDLDFVSISASIVTERDDRKSIECFVVLKGRVDWEQANKELRENILIKLPKYMLPREFHRIDSIPMMPSGKINRHALIEKVN